MSMQISSFTSLLTGSRLSRVGMRALTIFTAIACVSMIAASTSVVAAKRYETRNKPRLLAGGATQGNQPGAASADNSGGTDTGQATAAPGEEGQPTAAGSASGPAAGPAAAAQPSAAAPGTPAQQAPKQGQAAAAAATCTDANP